jgi:hypothetical protein
MVRHTGEHRPLLAIKKSKKSTVTSIEVLQRPCVEDEQSGSCEVTSKPALYDQRKKEVE